MLFLENYVTSEGAVSHNVSYYQQLSIARFQISFYANNYFDYYNISVSCPVPLYEYNDIPAVNGAADELPLLDDEGS